MYYGMIIVLLFLIVGIILCLMVLAGIDFLNMLFICVWIFINLVVVLWMIMILFRLVNLFGLLVSVNVFSKLIYWLGVNVFGVLICLVIVNWSLFGVVIEIVIWGMCLWYWFCKLLEIYVLIWGSVLFVVVNCLISGNEKLLLGRMWRVFCKCFLF